MLPLRLPRTTVGRVGLAGLALVGICLGWWLHLRRPEVQVPATFARLAEAFADNDAAGVVATLHPDYDWQAAWPTVFNHQDDLKAMLGKSNDPELDRPRGLAKAALRQWFIQHITNRLELTWTVREWRANDDGTITCFADLSLNAANGSLVKIDPPLQRHRFVLAGYGIGPRLRILSHERIPVQLPF
jgi:hypothetical protein